MASGDVFPKRLGGPTQLGTTATTLFTVPSARQFTTKQIIICNTDGVDRWVTLGVGGITAATAVVFQMPIAKFDTIVLDTALVFEATDTLQGASDTASKVTVTCTGWEREI
jgi:hypothetical protein